VEEAARPGPARRVFVGPHGLRAGWRILLFALLAYAITVVLGSLAIAAGARMEGSAGFAALLAAVLLAGTVLIVAVDRRPPGARGFPRVRRAAWDSLVGTGIGGALLGAAVSLLAVAGMVRWVADRGTVPEYVAVLASTFVFFALAAAWEEAVFRGYAFQALVQGIGVWPAVLASSALFAAAHGANPNVTPVGLANIFLAGVMLAVAYLRTRSLWFATGVHLGWNWTMATLLDFQVSGFVSDTPLYSASAVGPAIWTGGAFGPEAGIPATLAIAGGTAWLWRTRRLAPSAGMRARRPLVDDRLAPEAA
jgi:membrane protease YdiL (CAAX protease family)